MGNNLGYFSAATLYVCIDGHKDTFSYWVAALLYGMAFLCGILFLHLENYRRKLNENQKEEK